MLVITRRELESLTLNHNIVVTVLKSKNGKVKIGIEAPAEVSVVRSELPEKGAA